MVCSKCKEKGHTEKTCLSEFQNIERIDNKNTECSICLSKVNKPMCKTKCGHIFHITCLKEWLKKNITCPLCREKILPADPDDVLCLILGNIMDNIDEIYLLTNPGMINQVVDSYFQNENLI